MEKNFIDRADELTPSVNDTQYKRILVIGDIHGKFDEFISMWEKINVTSDDLVIFVGDYIDRGNQSVEVLQWLMKKSHEENIICLCGNHEQMMTSTFFRKANPNDWLYNGGKNTLDGLKKIENPAVLAEIINFVANLAIYHSIEIGGKEYIFVHAGIEEGFSLDEQDIFYLLWERKKFLDKDEGYNGKATIIIGHTPIQRLYIEKIPDSNNNALMIDLGYGEKFLVANTQEENIKIQPYKIPDRNILMLDTGSQGKISCVDILTGEFWQS